MKNIVVFSAALFLMFLYFFISCTPEAEEGKMGYIKEKHVQSVVSELIESHGEDHRLRIEKGVAQTARLWRKEDGDIGAFRTFCMENFVSDPQTLETMVDRFDKNLESVYGHLTEMGREIREPLELDAGPVLPVDYLFANFSPFAHVSEDFFKTKIAFVILLNFPQYTLEEKLTHGSSWSRLGWAKARLAENFTARVPSEVGQKRNQAYVKADDYIANYNIHMHHCLTPQGERLFPAGMKLVTHWNLRDEIKAQYSHSDGLKRQEMVQTIMEKIVTQDIPQAVIDNPAVDWVVALNEVKPTTELDVEGVNIPQTVDDDPEPDTRYAHILNVFQAERMLDPYYPTMPTLMKRKFQRDREIPEEDVEALFVALMKSPQIEKTARFIEKRLGRKLRPFDIWYNGFISKGPYKPEDLDRIVSRKYPTPTAFEKDMPNILRKLGFDAKTARFLGSMITVDPSRGIGHASGAGRRVDKAHLRTRVPETGMDYKGYNIAVHEFGHNCEQVFSLTNIDYTLLQGVPNNGFTEAFAFVFQDRDLELLGLTEKDPMHEHLKALDVLWSTYEIAGVSLVDMRIWNWMYVHPKATPAQLKQAVIGIAEDVWNEFYAPVFGVQDVNLLAIYSHIVAYGLYIPDYTLGHIIAFQIEQYLKGKPVGREMERMCVQGRISPDLWMRNATGKSISVEPILDAAEEALKVLQEK